MTMSLRDLVIGFARLVLRIPVTTTLNITMMMLTVSHSYLTQMFFPTMMNI